MLNQTCGSRDGGAHAAKRTQCLPSPTPGSFRKQADGNVPEHAGPRDRPCRYGISAYHMNSTDNRVSETRSA